MVPRNLMAEVEVVGHGRGIKIIIVKKYQGQLQTVEPQKVVIFLEF